MSSHLKKLNENRKFALLSTFKSVLGTLVMYSILILMGNNLLPFKLTDYLLEFQWLFYLYIIYNFYIGYSDLNSYLNQSDHIQEIKERHKYPIAAFKDSIGRAEVFLELCNKKLEIVKYISPVPFVIYFLGVAMNNKPTILQLNIPVLNKSLDYKDFFIYSAFVLFIIYLIMIRHYMHAYKKQYLKVERLKSELHYYEEILQSIKETRRVEYKDTIEQIMSKTTTFNRRNTDHPYPNPDKN